MPCQVPRFSFPFVIGIVRLEPINMFFIWALISSQPSRVWRKPLQQSGMRWFKKSSTSKGTSGSKLSLIAKEAEVCFKKIFAIPFLIVILLAICCVIICTPLGLEGRVILLWCTIFALAAWLFDWAVGTPLFAT